MSRREKRIERLLRLPPTMPYREVAAILEQLGWTERRQVGSHHQWTKPGERTLPVAEHNGRVKVETLKTVKDLLEREGWDFTHTHHSPGSSHGGTMVQQQLTLSEALRAQYPFHAVASAAGGWYVYYPDLPGCATHAETWEELFHNAREVLELWLTSEDEQGHPIPAPSIGGKASWAADDFRVEMAPDSPPTHGNLGLTTRQAAHRLGISPRRVQALAQRRGVGQRIGRALIFSEADLAALSRRRPGRPRLAQQ